MSLANKFALVIFVMCAAALQAEGQGPPPCSGFQCGDNRCVNVVSECSGLLSCPGIECPNNGPNAGRCRFDASHCSCPDNAPVRCKDGSCVTNSTMCAPAQCPLVLCANNRCADRLSECKGPNTCPNEGITCTSNVMGGGKMGECRNSNASCGLCPGSLPFRCGDKCVGSASNCTYSACPTAFQCNNGGGMNTCAYKQACNNTGGGGGGGGGGQQTAQCGQGALASTPFTCQHGTNSSQPVCRDRLEACPMGACPGYWCNSTNKCVQNSTVCMGGGGGGGQQTPQCGHGALASTPFTCKGGMNGSQPVCKDRLENCPMSACPGYWCNSTNMCVQNSTMCMHNGGGGGGGGGGQTPQCGQGAYAGVPFTCQHGGNGSQPVCRDRLEACPMSACPAYWCATLNRCVQNASLCTGTGGGGGGMAQCGQGALAATPFTCKGGMNGSQPVCRDRLQACPMDACPGYWCNSTNMCVENSTVCMHNGGGGGGGGGGQTAQCGQGALAGVPFTCKHAMNGMQPVCRDRLEACPMDACPGYWCNSTNMCVKNSTLCPNSGGGGGGGGQTAQCGQGALAGVPFTCKHAMDGKPPVCRDRLQACPMDACPGYWCNSTNMCVENSTACMNNNNPGTGGGGGGTTTPTCGQGTLSHLPVTCRAAMNGQPPLCKDQLANCPPDACPGFFCASINKCLSSQTQCSNTGGGNNGCPASDPYRCNDPASTCVPGVAYCPCPPGDGKCLSNGTRVDGSLFLRGFCVPGTQQSCGTTTCPADKVRCQSDGSCANNYGECPCPLGLSKCPNGLCANNTADCQDQNSCAPPRVLCWDSSCQDDFQNCPCPPDKVQCADTKRCATTQAECTSACGGTTPAQCWDSSCRSSFDLCPCPPNAPHKCADTGRCAQNSSFCGAICPPGKVQCFGTTKCVDSPEQCGCPPSNPVRCPSGTCVTNSSMCLANGACPATAPVRCWDNQCAGTHAECQCPPTSPFRCASIPPQCAVDSSACPKFNASALCPPDMVVCEDAKTCRRTLSECPTSVRCPPGNVLCPDGFTCGRFFNECRVAEACPAATPLRCPTADQKCVADLQQCPTPTTCPSGNVACPDGSCAPDAASCKALIVCGGTTPVRCPDGRSCRAQASDCPQLTSCPSGTVKCQDGACRTSLDKCPAALVCGNAQVRCPDGSCASGYDQCSTVAICVAPLTVKCEDGTCTDDIKKCAPPSDCPVGLVRCPRGECATAASQCPQYIQCPATAPVLCPDQSCKTDAAQCAANAALACPPSRQHRCGDGHCVTKPEECSTKLCPSTAPVKCADGHTCVTDVAQCPDITATQCDAANGQVRCPDGTCKANHGLCGSNPACPADRTKCWDGQCAASLAQCPPYQRCPNVTCPTGECARTVRECATVVKCDQPGRTFLCASDLSCRLNADACPAPQACPNNVRRCPSGACADAQGQCGTPVSCPPDTPFKCPDSTCVRSNRDCVAVECKGTTPYLCPTDGSCVSGPAACQDLPACPVATPIRCPNQRCVANVTECVAGDNVCPAHKPQRCPDRRCYAAGTPCPEVPCPFKQPFRCPDSSCAVDASRCAKLSDGCLPGTSRCWNGLCEATCTQAPTCTAAGTTRCADGVCRAECGSTQANGCPLATPFRCANHSCVSRAQDCPAAVCPASAPIRCEDGFCAASIANCPRSRINRTLCTDVNRPVLCANGDCVAAADECSVVLPCPTDKPTRCANGQCRANQGECPPGNNCPLDWVMCNNGKCAPTQAECLAGNGCPSNAPVRCSRGSCVQSQAQCPAQPVDEAPNGCPVATPYRCWDRSCVATQASCPSTTGCPATMPFRCPDGQCAGSEANCSALTGCPSGQSKCADGACVQDRSTCRTVNGCPIGTPQRCPDGSCQKRGECVATTVCPATKPVKCADFSCAATETDCRPLATCPSGQKRCVDGTCGDATTCAAAAQRCPDQMPVRCPLGECVETPADCAKTAACTDPTTPFLCADGQCRASQKLCYDQVGAFSSCATGEVVCPDGSCASTFDACDPIKRCPKTTPKKCPDGTCVSGTTVCGAAPTCPGNQRLCDDSVCREACPPSDSCGLGKVECDDGRCVSDETQCLCAGTNAMRCWDGSCQGGIGNRTCPTPPFRRQLVPVRVTVSLLLEQTPAIVGSDGTELGVITIPAGAVRGKDGNAVAVRIQGAPRSRYENYTRPAEWTGGVTNNIFSSVLEVDANNVSEPFPQPTKLCVDKDLIPQNLMGNYASLCFAYYKEEARKVVCASNITESADGSQVCGLTRHFTDFFVSNSVQETDAQTSSSCLGGGNCNGHGTCNGDGSCSCNTGYTGDDCSVYNPNATPTPTPNATPTPTASPTPTPTPTPKATTVASDASSTGHLSALALAVLCVLASMLVMA